MHLIEPQLTLKKIRSLPRLKLDKSAGFEHKQA